MSFYFKLEIKNVLWLIKYLQIENMCYKLITQHKIYNQYLLRKKEVTNITLKLKKITKLNLILKGTINLGQLAIAFH